MNNDKIDIIYRNVMILTGAITALLFILSLIAMIEFPKSVGLLLTGEIFFAVVFFVLRTIYRFRTSYKIQKNKPH